MSFAFQVFDLDGSGYIDSEELKKIVKATNMANDKQLERKARHRSASALRNSMLTRLHSRPPALERPP